MLLASFQSRLGQAGTIFGYGGLQLRLRRDAGLTRLVELALKRSSVGNGLREFRPGAAFVREFRGNPPARRREIEAHTAPIAISPTIQPSATGGRAVRLTRGRLG